MVREGERKPEQLRILELESGESTLLNTCEQLRRMKD